MRLLRDTVWQRIGISWIWNNHALVAVAPASQVISMRAFIQLRKQWPDVLPSNKGNAVVVSGLDGCLDLLTPEDGEAWLAESMKSAILSFQDQYSGDAALIFWLPTGGSRVVVENPSDTVSWHCASPYTDRRLAFGRLLWGEAYEYPQHIMVSQSPEPVGLFHRRIS